EGADEAVPGRIAPLENAAARIGSKVGECSIAALEFQDARDLHVRFGKKRECEGAIVLDAVAEGAAADDVVALAAQAVLKLAEANRLEQDHSLRARRANPLEFALPLVDAGDEPRHGPFRERLANAHLDLVTFADQPQV